VKWLSVLALVGVGSLAALAFVWMRERRARTVFPASQSAALLNPARGILQPSGWMVRAFGICEGQRVLEVGPGPGYFTVETARVVGPRGCVVCVDLQRGMIDALRDHAPSAALGIIRPLVASATRLPLHAGCVDAAFVVAVLGEVPELREALAELCRVLRPGGILAVAETLTDPDYIRQRTLRQTAESAGLRYLDRIRQPLGYIMRFTRAD